MLLILLIYFIEGQPTSAKGLGVPEDGGQEGELVEQARGLPNNNDKNDRPGDDGTLRSV